MFSPTGSAQEPLLQAVAAPRLPSGAAGAPSFPRPVSETVAAPDVGELVDWAVRAHAVLQQVRADFAEQMGRSPLVEAIDELLNGLPDAPFVDDREGPVTEATAGLDGDQPGDELALTLEKRLALVLRLLRLYIEHNGEAAQAAFLNDSIALVEQMEAGLPDDAKLLAAEHTAEWDGRGWPTG